MGPALAPASRGALEPLARLRVATQHQQREPGAVRGVAEQHRQLDLLVPRALPLDHRFPVHRFTVSACSVALLCSPSASRSSRLRGARADVPHWNVWLCRPGLKVNYCNTDLATTVFWPDGTNTTIKINDAKTADRLLLRLPDGQPRAARQRGPEDPDRREDHGDRAGRTLLPGVPRVRAGVPPDDRLSRRRHAPRQRESSPTPTSSPPGATTSPTGTTDAASS